MSGIKKLDVHQTRRREWMTDDPIEETTQLFENKLDQLRRVFVNKRKEYDKAKKTFSEWPLIPFCKKLFKPSKKSLRGKLTRLKREIPALEEEIEHYEEGLVHLEQGIYGSVVPLLEQLLLVASIRGFWGVRHRKILKLIEQLKALSS